MEITGRRAALGAGLLAAVALLVAGIAAADSPHRSAADRLVKGDGPLTWTTVFLSPNAIEGLTADASGRLYTADRLATGCRVLRIGSGGTATQVGTLAPPCSPSGLTFGPDRRLYVTNGSEIDVLTPDAAAPPTATVFATGVPGTNGLAFDRAGNLWTGDGSTGLGRVWKIAPDGTVTEQLRVQPMANAAGVGRQNETLPNPRPQSIVANGVAFDSDGSLLVADTARGAIWRVDLDRDGRVLSPTGCDETFPADTLCLDDVLVQHPYLDGADGFALDRAGNVWTAANERNAIVVASHDGRRVEELFRNPVDPATGLRNGGPLETPTSPVLTGKRLCVTQSDGGRRDNVPASAGESGHDGIAGKISCLDQELETPGAPVPVR
jgi:sugar lactone lactonase YvrE